MIVIVHGAFHWGGCFQKVADRLARRGLPVATPDLASHGYDTTPLAEIKSLADYVAPVEQIVREADRPIVLVGHSLGGVTLSYLAERYPDKIAKLIYVTAVMLKPGVSAIRSITDVQSPATQTGAVASASDGGGLELMRVPHLLKPLLFGDCSDRDIAIAAVNSISVNSWAPMLWTCDTTPQRFGTVPRVYVEALQDHALTIGAQRQYQRDVPGAKTYSLNSSHSPFFSQPQELADLIAAEAAH